MSDQTEGLVFAYLMQTGGEWKQIGWDEVLAWSPEQGPLWVHLDMNDPPAGDYIRNASGVDPLVQAALLTRETRPRVVAMGDGLLTILRGVNLNPGADADDMVAIRVWADSSRMISTRFRPLMAARDVRDQLSSTRPPQGIGDLFVQLNAALVDRMSNVIEDLDDKTDTLEDRVLEAQDRQIRTELTGVRQMTIAIRRHLSPQRDALAKLQLDELSWLDKLRKARLREITDRVIRYVEDLDAIRERAAVVQDELMNRLADQMNRNMYLLAIVATIMLPLGLLTGLLGINVDGMPGASDAPWAFTIVCLILVAVIGLEVWILKRLKWF